MAEFCDECRVKMGAPPGPKSDEAITKELAKKHGSWSLLCEGCCSGITYNSEGERSVVLLPGHPSYRPEEGAAVMTGLVRLTDEQKKEIASELVTDIRASLGVSFKKVCGPGQGINAGTLFEIIGMALTKFARAVDEKGQKEKVGDGWDI